MLPMVFHKASNDRAMASLKRALNFAKICSIELRSGEYGSR